MRKMEGSGNLKYGVGKYFCLIREKDLRNEDLYTFYEGLFKDFFKTINKGNFSALHLHMILLQIRL